ncbi:cytochrome P450 [Thozetella sp. PMI_491]|nr:cytochrome P450 [Thozetella sp. PMI_491]
MITYSLSLLLVLGAGLGLSCLVAFQLRSWHRLRHIPGPALGSVSVLWMLKHALGRRYHEKLKEASDKYGTLVRIGPNELLCTDPEVLKDMSAVRSPYTKGTFYETGRVVPGEDNIVSIRDEKKHKELRAKMGPAYSGKANDVHGLESGIDRQMAKLIELFERKYLSTSKEHRPFDFTEKSQFFALDVMGDLGFGHPFGYLSEDKDLHDFLQINASAQPVMNFLSTMPWLTNILHRWPLCLALPKEGDQVGYGRLMGFAKGLIDARLNSNEKHHKDMMQSLIDNGLTRRELVQQVFLQTIAGSNSSAYAMAMTLLCLLSSPASYATLQAEIDRGIAEGRISSPISDAEARKLPYLQAVVREGLRMYPPVTGLGFKQVPKGGDTINGYFVPEGTQVGQNFHGLCRSQEIWGPDADLFRPERWTEANEEEWRRMNGVVDLNFGSGKYSCLGKPIAMMELNKIFVELLRRFELVVVSPHVPVKTESSVFMLASDLWLRISRR